MNVCGKAEFLPRTCHNVCQALERVRDFTRWAEVDVMLGRMVAQKLLESLRDDVSADCDEEMGTEVF